LAAGQPATFVRPEREQNPLRGSGGEVEVDEDRPVLLNEIPDGADEMADAEEHHERVAPSDSPPGVVLLVFECGVGGESGHGDNASLYLRASREHLVLIAELNGM
jgi:hypothetical protein